MSMHGVVPIPGRLLDWQRDLLADHAALERLLEEHGSPVNLIDPTPLPAHAEELVGAAAAYGVEARVFFARKANKALALVRAALDAGHGVDVSSRAELAQVLGLGVDPDRLVLTAAVKPRALLSEAVAAGVVVAVDNEDELTLLLQVAAEAATPARIALRLDAELPGRPTRFGLPLSTWTRLLADDRWRHARVEGVHFHLHGYAAADRAAALGTALDLVEAARAAGHEPAFVDIGGGVPMRYLDDPGPWDAFWEHQRAAVAGRAEPQTWDGVGLGLRREGGEVVGSPTVYPLWQHPVRAEWLHGLLATDGVGARLRDLGLRLHLEPGRALLDGAGLTVARVEHRKQRADGTWLVGCAMNRTQVRSAADDFLLDPVLVPAPGREPTPPGEAYLVGAYCIEAELLTLRRMMLPDGVAVGDLVGFVNTAGYLMHILESASHQIPLARNLVRDGQRWRLDEIDGGPAPA